MEEKNESEPDDAFPATASAPRHGFSARVARLDYAGDHIRGQQRQSFRVTRHQGQPKNSEIRLYHADPYDECPYRLVRQVRTRA